MSTHSPSGVSTHINLHTCRAKVVAGLAQSYPTSDTGETDNNIKTPCNNCGDVVMRLQMENDQLASRVGKLEAGYEQLMAMLKATHANQGPARV
jgi:hypothetical protein